MPAPGNLRRERGFYRVLHCCLLPSQFSESHWLSQEDSSGVAGVWCGWVHHSCFSRIIVHNVHRPWRAVAADCDGIRRGISAFHSNHGDLITCVSTLGFPLMSHSGDRGVMPNFGLSSLPTVFVTRPGIHSKRPGMIGAQLAKTQLNLLSISILLLRCFLLSKQSICTPSSSRPLLTS